MLGLLVNLLILALIMGLCYWVITIIPLPEPFKTVVMVVFGIICVIVLISLLVGGFSFPYAGHERL